jgi:hypothetical protein
MIITRAHVLDPVSRETRIPTDAEMRVIAAFVQNMTDETGHPPLCDWEVPGVGEVLFSRDPRTPIPISE